MRFKNSKYITFCNIIKANYILPLMNFSNISITLLLVMKCILQ